MNRAHGRIPIPLRELLGRALHGKSPGHFDEEQAPLERALAQGVGDSVIGRDLALAKRPLARQLSRGRSPIIKAAKMLAGEERFRRKLEKWQARRARRRQHEAASE